MTRQGVLWGSAALLGIIATAVIAWSVSQITGQRIGLASAPFSVARGLAPTPAKGRTADGPPRSEPGRRRYRHGERLRERTVTVTTPAPTLPRVTAPPATVPVAPAPVAPAPVAPSSAPIGAPAHSPPPRRAGGDGSGDGSGGSHRDD